jgi:sugar phosphate isomerase/epimerase
MRSIFTFLLLLLPVAARAQPVPAIGMVAEISDDSLLAATGYSFRVEAIADAVSPISVSDHEFEQVLAGLKACRVPVQAANLFLPGHLKVVGPDRKESDVLEYARVVFQRCQRAGIRLIVWGSGGSRRIPDGFERSTAREQFITLARKLGQSAAECGITLALENLNREETNFINTLAEAHSIVREVSQTNVRLCADIFHMLREGESPESIRRAGTLIVHCDIAENVDRSPPGTHGEDFAPYLQALRQSGYRGRITLECRWDDPGRQAQSARIDLQQQLDSVYKK